MRAALRRRATRSSARWRQGDKRREGDREEQSTEWSVQYSGDVERLVDISVDRLRWSDFAAPLAAFDPGPARRIATEALPGGLAALNAESRQALADAIDRRLLAAYGPWVTGWTWASSEPGGGGPVRGWCCAPHSLLPKGPGEPAATVERVVGAVTEWREFLVGRPVRAGRRRVRCMLWRNGSRYAGSASMASWRATGATPLPSTDTARSSRPPSTRETRSAPRA